MMNKLVRKLKKIFILATLMNISAQANWFDSATSWMERNSGKALIIGSAGVGFAGIFGWMLGRRSASSDKKGIPRAVQPLQQLNATVMPYGGLMQLLVEERSNFTRRIAEKDKQISNYKLLLLIQQMGLLHKKSN